jgi:uncharacterized protein
MIAVDTNILVYAHRKDSAWHEAASSSLKRLAEGRARWAIPWPVVHEFVSVVTHPRIYAPPSTLKQALHQVSLWMGSPSLVLLSEESTYWDVLQSLASKARLKGPMIHDARIAALCTIHGVRELWSADRDFSRLSINTRNPLLEE